MNKHCDTEWGDEKYITRMFGITHTPLYNLRKAGAIRLVSLRQEGHSIPYLPIGAPPSAEESMKVVVSDQAIGRMALASAILDNLPADEDEKNIGEMVAHFIEFHRRGNKPMWWSMFERAAMTEEELYDDLGA